MTFIAGPRQVGKTTLARQFLQLKKCGNRYFNWDIESHRKAILKSPERFWTEDAPAVPALVARDREKPCVVLDEIHKYPRWKRFLKGLYDAVSGEVDIIVTGSGRLDIYQRGGDSLFGRYGLYRLHPFSTGEIVRDDRRSVRPPKDALDAVVHGKVPAGASEALSRLEKFTGFPEPLFAGSESRLRRWRRGRNHLVLREDLRDLTSIRDIGLVEALVELLPERIGSLLSLNALREDLNVAYGSVRQWVDALARLYYLFEVRPYAGRLARTLRKEAKVYLFDGSAIEDPGARFENLVALHLLKACDAWNDRGLGDFDLHYVRDREKHEVDFLVTSDRKPFVLVEAKLSEQDASPSLFYFKERLNPPWSFQVVRNTPPGALYKHGKGVFVASAARFLAQLP